MFFLLLLSCHSNMFLLLLLLSCHSNMFSNIRPEKIQDLPFKPLFQLSEELKKKDQLGYDNDLTKNVDGHDSSENGYDESAESENQSKVKREVSSKSLSKNQDSKNAKISDSLFYYQIKNPPIHHSSGIKDVKFTEAYLAEIKHLPKFGWNDRKDLMIKSNSKNLDLFKNPPIYDSSGIKDVKFTDAYSSEFRNSPEYGSRYQEDLIKSNSKYLDLFKNPPGYGYFGFQRMKNENWPKGSING